MQLLRNLPLNRKLTLISMVTSCASLLLACGVIVAYEVVSTLRSMEKEVLMTARIIGDNSAAALSFDDPDSAEQTLQSLSASEHFLAAFIYDAEGEPFARYQRPGDTPLTPPPVEWHFHRFTPDYFELFLDISAGGESIGTVYVRHSMLELKETLTRSGYLILVAMTGASLVALLLTRKLQPFVAGPIMDLAQVVRDVGNNQNFSVRAVKRGDDEVGRLIDGFNAMLSQIQQRDLAIESARNELEQRVEERTSELAASLSMLNATLDSTADGIVALNLSREVVCQNTKFTTMWGMPAEGLDSIRFEEIAAFTASRVSHPKQFLQRVEELFENLGSEEFDVIELRDGRTFERYIQPQLIGGECVGMVANFRDITERRRAETELEKAYKQLLETSRQAGMAEVATSVLHNVGNVLNSVNVSCSVVANKVRKSRIASVTKTADLLREHADDLASFFTNNPTGQKLPNFLGKLSDRLSEEQAQVLEELQVLSRNIEHIKDIVSMQQDYARVSGVTETLQVAALVEDSLRMNDGSLLRHEVKIVRRYDEVPPVTVEKHKVLQILVNLIRNAKHACEESGRPDKQMELRVCNVGDRVHITVEDNGVGISHENLTRIFAHGFTTKRDGHGFGLHSSVLAAEELGGRLTAHSDGAGAGATFILELPVDPTGNN